MLSLFFLSEVWRILLILISLVAFSIQLGLLVLIMYRSRQAGRLLSQKLLEVLILLGLAGLAWQLVLVGFASSAGLIQLALYPRFRYIIFTLLVFLAGLVFYQERHWISLLAPLAAFFILPLWDAFAYFNFCFSLSLLMILVRSIYLSSHCYKILVSSLSDLSVLEALDNLPSGVLFYAGDGYIHLQNKTMQRLLGSLLGNQLRDGQKVYQDLLAGNVLTGLRTHILETAVIYEMPDHSIWRFKHDLVSLGQSSCHQLAAADITEQWQLTQELAEQEKTLVAQKTELEKMLADLARLSRQKELQDRKNRVHDVLGQRIALLQNALRQVEPDLTILGQSLAGLADDLARDEAAVALSLEQIINSFASVGVAIKLEGAPGQDETGLLMLDLIREAVTNAVRHGLAGQINIHCHTGADWQSLTISNNGTTPAAITEGGGIKAMREKIKPFAGQLLIRTRPQFVLTILLSPAAEGGRSK